MRLLISLLVIAYLIGVGVALAPAIKGSWSTVSMAQLAQDISEGLPKALSWPLTAYRNMTSKPETP